MPTDAPLTLPRIGKRIRLPITENDTRVNARRTYLIKYEGQWILGKFERERYGWNFAGYYDAGIQVDYDGWEAVYEFHA